MSKEVVSPSNTVYYAYDLPDDLVLNLVPFTYSENVVADSFHKIHSIFPDPSLGSPVPESSLTTSSDPPDRPQSPGYPRIENGKLRCSFCGLVEIPSPGHEEARKHYRKDFHKLNIRRKLKNLPPLTEDEFEQQIGELDESISGSDEFASSEDEVESDGKVASDKAVSSLLKRTHLGPIDEVVSDEEESGSSNNQGKPGSPYAFFTSASEVVNGANKLPDVKVLAIYKALLNPELLSSGSIKALKALKSSSGSLSSHSIILMIGGGHFAGAVISHVKSKKKTIPPNSLTSIEILSHKSFHRYTTRRKQGGSQSANDNARGKANSAGSTLRRYNEQALEKEIHELLDSWKSYIETCEHIYIRASGRSNRGILMNYPKAPIISSDKRISGLPFTTGRATATEVKRAWIELTTVKLMDKPEAVIKKTVTKEDIKRQIAKSRSSPSPAPSASLPEILTPDEKHSNELISLIKKSRSPRLAAYLKSNNISGDFLLQPASQYQTTPNLLFYASSQGSHHIITTLLISLQADPTVKNKQGRTAVEVAADRTTIDAFQLARATLGEDKWDWAEAKVGPALTKTDIENRTEQEKAQILQKRIDDLAKIENDEAQNRVDKTVSRHGAGHKLSSNVLTSVGPESSLRGLSDEARMRLERERRARAAEARFKVK